MDNYIKSKGHQPIGPLIQYATTKMNDEGEIDLTIKLMRQSDNYINHVEEQYGIFTRRQGLISRICRTNEF